ncbi:MAG: glycosyltransferase family 4 protein [Bacteroidales bacterium]|nr:glycosyltransferase family 4 protein [Bacteroidales bacterium]
MKKVAYITSGKIGIHRFTYNELVELEKSGIDFILCLTQLKPGPWMSIKTWHVIVASKSIALKEFIQLFFKKNILLIKLLCEAQKNKVIPFFFIALSFYRVLKKNNISSLHCQMGDDKLYIGYFLKQLLHIPLTVTIHAHELYQRRVYDNNKSIQKLFSSCDKVITISSFNAGILNNKFGIPNEKIEIMKLFPEIDNNNYIRDKTKILIVANWAEKKGYKILFEAIRELKRNDFTLWVVGGTYFSDNSIDLYELVKEKSVEDKVALLGRQGGVILDIIFSACDIFCLPSFTELYEDGLPAEREGIPVALMEAMAWGKPVISTKHAGIPELVEEVLVEERNVMQLKDAIVYLLDHPEKWKEMGEKNKRLIAEKFSHKNVKILADTFKQWQ